jgi:hypothetical protein
MRILFVAAIATSLGVHSSQCMADEGSCVGKVWNGREAKPELKMFPPNEACDATARSVAQLFGAGDSAYGTLHA